jgi:hemerythrin superfamily protein
MSVITSLSPGITRMIRMDHSHVLLLSHKYRAGASPSLKKALFNTIAAALEIHAQLEEEVFYPALRAVKPDEGVLSRSVPEHDEMRRMIALLRSMQPGDALYDDTFMRLMRDVMHHIADEETVLLPEAERLLGDQLQELGVKMTKRRVELAAARAREIAVNHARATPVAAFLLAAGSVLAGGYLLRRTISRTSS